MAKIRTRAIKPLDMTKKVKPIISKKRYDEFVDHFYSAKSKYRGQYFGDAFYTHFELDKMSDQVSLHNIRAKTGDHAQRSIKEIFDII